MPSYVVLGASRGIGFSLVKVISEKKDNTVVALVRSVDKAKEKFASELPDRKNIHVVYADLNDRKSLQASVEKVSAITGGAVDVFVANGAIGSGVQMNVAEEVNANPERFEKDMNDQYRTNVVGTIEALAFYAPLVEKSQLKKAVVISSAMGDISLVRDWDIGIVTPYAISKVAINMAVAKFHVEYKKRGVLFFAISPGLVATEFGQDPNAPELTEAEKAQFDKERGELVQKFMKYAPHWKPEPLTPDQSAAYVADVIDKATIAKDGGRMVSHLGTDQWL